MSGQTGPLRRALTTATLSRTLTVVLASMILALACLINAANWTKVGTSDAFELGALVHDDAYYYLLIAENIVAGNGVTFDGVNPTTGFQPLYQGVAIGLSLLARVTHISLVHWTLVSGLLFSIAAAVVLGTTINRVTRSQVPWLTWYLVAVLLPLNFPLVFKRLGAGMEMALAFFLLSLAFWAWCSSDAQPRGHLFRLAQGILLGVLTLTRLDYAVLALVLAISIITRRHGRDPRHVAAVALGWLLPLGGYALIAHFCLDSLVPVSVLAKHHYASALASTLPLDDRVYLAVRNLGLQWLYPLGYALYGFYWRWGAVGAAIAAVPAFIGAGILLFAAKNTATVLTGQWGFRWFVLAVLFHALAFSWSAVGFVGSAFFWYYTPELLLITIGIIVPCALGTHSRFGLASMVGLGVSAVFVGSTLLYDPQRDIASYAPYRRVIERTRDVTPPTAVIGSWDAGFNAYWLRPRRVVNLDGMVNSRKYLADVIAGRPVSEYLSSQGIEYLLNMVPDTAEARGLVESRFFLDPSIPRNCYDILAAMPFERQRLVVYLVKYTCR